MSDVFDRLKAALADRYAVERELGSGGMAVVYLATDLRHERQVAIKVLRPELTSVVAAERFLREIKLTAGLTHPHVLPLLDSGEADGLLYYVMPRVEGESLRELLEREKQLPVDEAVRIAREVADALGYAHGRNLLHRDIKPENILLAEGHAVVADFGIARALSEAGGDRLTDTGISIGTPTYMSPEQAAGEREIGEASDLYSVACVLYEMLTGEPPISDESRQAAMSRKLLGDFRPVSEVRSEVPARVDIAVSKALATEPAERFATASEFTEALAPDRAERSMGSKRRWVLWTAAAAVVLVVGLTWYFGWDRATGPVVGGKSVAVLPFANLGGDPDREYFSDGITGEIINHLMNVADLPKVISRTSSMHYKDTDKNLRQIADELGVATIVEGEVLQIGDRVRINVQLIDAETDEHIWAGQYNRQLADIFDIQSDVAQQIAVALEAALTPVEREHIEREPTDNQDAYDYYLRGQAYTGRSILEQDIRVAIHMYENAVGLDPNFAVAFAELSEVHLLMYWYYYDRTEERLAQAKQAVDTAFRLVPQLPEAHRAMGFYYYLGHLDYSRALEQFEIAREGQPNSSRIFAGMAYVLRRQGKFDQVLPYQQRAVELDPLSAVVVANLALTYGLLRDYREAVRYVDRASALTPEWPTAYAFKAKYYLSLYGTTQEALAVLEQASLVVGDEAESYFARAAVLYRAYDGRFQEAMARLDALAEESLGTQFFLVPKSLLAAQVYSWMNQPEIARANYDTARAILERKVQEMPDDSRAHSSLGLAYAGLGRNEDAVREGKLAVELMPVTKDAWKGVWRVEDLARIYAMVGEHDAAIEQLDYLLSIPGELSVNLLRLDPSWDPLRDHPRFQALLAKYE